ncbi:MAG: alpha-D-ribose 1-methylphosphonate 5-triphosphate diphosphatase [Candidatus Puniceispirillales bacterium]
MSSFTLANATILSVDHQFTGLIHIENGLISEVEETFSIPDGAEDCHGDYISPGLIELHTDNLERHLEPRPEVKWPIRSAVLAHDNELASAGITTVFDAIRVGSILSNKKARYDRYARQTASVINSLVSEGVMKISHFIHLRAETCSETLIEELDEFNINDRVRMISLMDHTPGQRQFRDISKLEEYLSDKHNMDRKQLDEYFDFQRGLQNRLGTSHSTATIAKAKLFDALLASHDDTTIEDVKESKQNGTALAEFPTTLEAAEACRDHGIAIMMGAPNLIRGGSHSGNIAASKLEDLSLLDILSSDYVPSSLLLGAVFLGLRRGNMASGLSTVTSAPAKAAGLNDRGVIKTGFRADLLRFKVHDDLAIIKAVYSNGNRVS